MPMKSCSMIKKIDTNKNVKSGKNKNGNTSGKGSIKTGAKKKPQNINTLQKSEKPERTPGQQNEKLIKQLNKLIIDLNEEGLRTLIRQTHIMLHNMQVEMSIQECNKSKKKQKAGEKSLPQNKHTIEVEAADDNRYFILIINYARNFFSLEEMKKLVKICHFSEDESDAAGRLYNWFSKNRKDVLQDTNIEGVTDAALNTIYNFIKTNYKLKE